MAEAYTTTQAPFAERLLTARPQGRRPAATAGARGEWVDYAGDIVYGAEQFMQKLNVPSLQGLADRLEIPDVIRGRKISQAFRQAIYAARQQ